jgi:hypothetical protein
MTTKQQQSGRKASESADTLGSNSEIGRKLKQYYDGLLSEEVPDRFAALLAQLDQADASRKPE